MIRSDTCPYCGAPYTIADAGCRAKCGAMRVHQKLVQDAIDADEGEAFEGLPPLKTPQNPL